MMQFPSRVGLETLGRGKNSVTFFLGVQYDLCFHFFCQVQIENLFIFPWGGVGVTDFGMIPKNDNLF